MRLGSHAPALGSQLIFCIWFCQTASAASDCGVRNHWLFSQLPADNHQTIGIHAVNLKNRSCPGEWCNNGAAVVISGRAGLIKPSPRRAA
jgi:hypothetical protein